MASSSAQLGETCNQTQATCDVRSWAARLVRVAKANGLTLATAESCTAGALACTLADAEGAGEVLHGGFVVYSKVQKSAALGIPPSLFAEQTAVSSAVVRAMAKGALERCPTDIAVAITGVAGPEPDEDGNPVGLIFIAVARRDGRLLEQRLELAGSKDLICRRAMVEALQLTEHLMQ